mmetsp:Transcript_20102/g.53925  ORF Transcript_20102/g.53925 Transcript_20102/m.53925 type:complete len:142 (+) Transcript_20102:467-892(+)
MGSTSRGPASGSSPTLATASASPSTSLRPVRWNAAGASERATPSKTARRRKQRLLADQRAEFQALNTARADGAAAAALAMEPGSVARHWPHLCFPRSESESPPRPPAPCPTPRPPDRPSYRAYDGAKRACELEEDEDEDVH